MFKINSSLAHDRASTDHASYLHNSVKCAPKGLHVSAFTVPFAKLVAWNLHIATHFECNKDRSINLKIAIDVLLVSRTHRR